MACMAFGPEHLALSACTYDNEHSVLALLADFFLLRRFLRARTYDLPKSLTMFMDNIAWRRENQVDTVLQVRISTRHLQLASATHIYSASHLQQVYMETRQLPHTVAWLGAPLPGLKHC